MTKFLLLIICSLMLMMSIGFTQEVIIDGFPKGIGESVDQEFFKKYLPQLKAISDSLHKYPQVNVIITGSADGEQYRMDHDAKNPGLALGRAHTLRDLLVNQFNVDRSQIIINSEEHKSIGDQYRYASVRMAWQWEIVSMKARLDTLESRAPVEKHFTEVKEVTQVFSEDYGIQLSAGVSTSPFGGIPVVATAVTWKKILFFEIMGGHTIWNSSYTFENSKLDSRKRMLGGSLIVFPFENHRVGFVGGWIRVEQIAQEYYDYVRLSEGPVFGVKVPIKDYIAITGLYNPSKHRVAGNDLSISKNGQFMLNLTIYKIFGGTK